ncbi:SURF1 family protein [Pseudohongiella acticola]|jgi:surfeit locus 1 family protein|uniref:SURF1 family protein n=1 Tax=Pseudohongiella acticola TaxID=1524254 RepID=UPI0030EF45B8
MRLGTTLQLGRLTVQVDAFIVLCIFLSCGMFISLGFWQLDRAAEKRALAAAYQSAAQADPVPFAELPQTDVSNNLRVALQGRFRSEISFLVLYQFFQGRPGYELVTPFRPATGGDLVLISRGWIAPGNDGGPPTVPAVEGETSVLARLHLPETTVPAGEVTDNSWPVRLPRLNIEQTRQLLGEPVYPYVLRLEAGQPGVLGRHWSQPDFSTRSHYAYTAQWFGLALLVLLASFAYASNVLSLIRER